MVGVVDNIAKRQLLLKRYTEAEESYRRALGLAEGLTAQAMDARTKALGIAGIYHQLGYVAQEQRQWKQAEEHYQKALQLLIEFQDQHGQGIALRSLARLWQATADPNVLTEVARILGMAQEDAKRLLEGGVAAD